MKGIILAGGSGTRLYPLTSTTSKQLQPVYDKPMIYYPLSTLMLGGIREILIISSPRDLPGFEALLGDGSRWGLDLQYKAQPRPEGIAQAFLLGKDFIGTDAVTLILGDNIFFGSMKFRRTIDAFEKGALIFGYYVHDPERYGVVDFDQTGRVLGIEEKPSAPRSNYAVPGLYVYDNRVLDIAAELEPSARGELEITDLNMEYLKRDELNVRLLGRGIAWLDTGTPTSLHEAADYIAAIQNRQGLRVSCPEEIAMYMGFIDQAQMETLIAEMPNCDYRAYLEHRFIERPHYWDDDTAS